MDEQAAREAIEDYRNIDLPRLLAELSDEPTFQELRDWNRFQMRGPHADLP